MGTRRSCFERRSRGLNLIYTCALTLPPKPCPSQNPIVEISPDPGSLPKLRSKARSEPSSPARAEGHVLLRSHVSLRSLAPVVTCTGSNFSFLLETLVKFQREFLLSGARLAEDLRFELAILATVQGFYQKLMRDALGGDVPIPSGLDEDALRHSERELPTTLSRMYRWLHLLDMAITPAMVRQALTPDTDSEVAEALLRYFVRRREPSDVNRDKTDLIATFLYRHPRVPGQWEQTGYGLDGALPLSPFEIALIEILADSDVPSLPEEHVQLLRRFDPLREEVARFRDFNTLIDSGIIGRVRELKQWLDASFYHPGVLATVAAYNATFRQEVRRTIRQGVGRDQELRPSARGNGWNDSDHGGRRGSHGRPRGGDSRETTAGSRLWQHVREIPPSVEAEEGTGPASADSALAADVRRGTRRERRGVRGGCAQGSQSSGSEGCPRQRRCFSRRRLRRNRSRPKKANCAASRNRFGSLCAWPIRNTARSCPCDFST